VDGVVVVRRLVLLDPGVDHSLAGRAITGGVPVNLVPRCRVVVSPTSRLSG
jgi:hypothetical protein